MRDLDEFIDRVADIHNEGRQDFSKLIRDAQRKGCWV